MIVAFDCQGVLVTDGPTPHVWETRVKGIIMPRLIKHLITGGAEVYCLSAVPADSYGVIHPRGYECLSIILRGIPLSGVYAVGHPPGATPYEIGKLKAKYMEKCGAEIMFDDIPEVVRGIRDAGKIAVEYSTAWEK